MLSDFLLLETYYDAPDSVQIYEDITRRYGRTAVQKAVEAGYIMAGRRTCGRKRGLYFRITDKGREQAAGKA